MKISLAQLTSSQNKEENLEKAQKYVKSAKEDEADLVVFPEIFMCYVPANSHIKLAEVAETLEGHFVSEMSKMAQKNNIYILFGMYESKEDENSKAYNTIVLINREGKIIESYRKTHLYDAFVNKESDRVVPSDNPIRVAKTDIGNIGLMICYELRFPEIARKLTLEGADIIIAPTAWVKGEMKENHWSTLLASRAIENTTFIAGCNQIGNTYTGSSMIYDPMGVRLASGGEEETLITTKIEYARTKRVRKSLPCLDNRRPEFYTN